MKPFYLTTAIDYANGSPHLGHAYEKVLADAIARTQRLRGQPVHFLTGLDEHGQKVQASARARGLEPQAICDVVAAEFQTLLRALGISNDDYIRTTEPRHKDAVRAILQKLYDQGDIYLGEYRGYYSARQEQFLLEKDKVEGKWPELYGEVVDVVEPNYFFKLARHQAWLGEFLQSNPQWIFPAFRQKQVVEFLKEPLNDLCISRPRDRLEWGIPLPFDEKFVTYVWFDALVNYVSAVGYGTEDFAKRWPADAHVIGKDILVPPHAVYWPIMLKAMGAALPKRLVVHGWWLSGGKKESKTDIEKAKAAGLKVASPLDLIAQHGADAFRYFLLREMVVGQDSEFTTEQFVVRYNSELANDFGNLVARLLNMGARYSGGVVPQRQLIEQPENDVIYEWKMLKDPPLASGDNSVIERLSSKSNIPVSSLRFTNPGIVQLCDDFEFHAALEGINRFVKTLNRYVEIRSPWKLFKSTDAIDRHRVDTCLAVMAEGIRLAAVAYAPFMPKISAQVLALLGQTSVSNWSVDLEWDETRLTGAKLGEKEILFPKIETESEAEAKKK